MVNNLELIKPLLVFPKKDDSFYFIQILQRKKDNPSLRMSGSNNNSRTIKTYYINSIDKLDLYWEEMVKLADLFNARVSINLNPRSFEKAAFQVMSKIAHQMENKDFYNIRNAYNSVLGNYHAEIDKRWLVDIDKDNIKEVEQIKEHIQLIQQVDYAKRVQKYISAPKVILATIPTKNGCHLITQSFNLSDFQYKNIEIHKNNPTLLYCP